MSKKIIKIVILIIVLILVFALGTLVGAKVINKNDNANSKNNAENETSDITKDETKAINFYEDFSTSGTIKNLKNAIWNSARFTQIDNILQVELTVMNSSEKEKIEPTNVTVNLFDKYGNIVLTKDVELPELETGYKQKTVNLEFDIEEFIIIYDIQIVANDN